MAHYQGFSTEQSGWPSLEPARVLDSISDALIVLDRNWTIVYANPMAARLNGKSPEEFVGKTHWEEWPESVGTEVEHQYRRAIADNVSVHFEHMYRDNPREMWLDINAYPAPEGLIICYRDISDRKTAEQRLALSEQRFRVALGHTSVVVFEQDRELRYTWVYNSRSIYAPELILGRTDSEVMPGEYGDRLMSLKKRVIEEGVGTRTEVTVSVPEGLIHYDLALEPLKDGLGAVYGVTGAAFDITERKRAEQTLFLLSLLSSEIATLLASSVDIISTLDLCAKLLLTRLESAFVRIWLLNDKNSVLELVVSQGQYTHLDGPHSKIPVGQFKIGLIAQERKPHVTNSVLGDPRVSDQEWARREGMVAFAGYPLVVGERLKGVLALFSRNTINEAVHLSLSSISHAIAAFISRTRRERELRAVQDRRVQVLESITDGFFALDREWRFTYVNHRFEEIVGLSLEVLVGKTIWEAIADLLGSTYEQHYREAVRTGKPVSFEAYYPPLKLWTEAHAYPTEEGLSVYFQDISERKRLEAKLRDTAKLESLGVMAGGIAHDFNNLLTGILGNASLLVDRPNAEDRDLAEHIVSAAERAANLTQQMLAYSGKGRFEVRALDLSVQVREILPLIQPMVDKDVEIQLHLAEKLPCIEADSGQMQQLIMNLIINGAEAMGGRSGRVIVTTIVTDVDETFIAHMFSAHEIPPGRYVCLEIQDTGSGMNEETKAKIFDPFFTTKFTGRGLGLAAVSGIVRGHKGALRVYSSLGEGTTFKVFLPALASKGQEAKADKGVDAKRLLGQGTILLVDDEELVRQVGRACLERQGYSVLLANNGREAITMFRSQSTEITLIILDMTMPVMGGEEALGRLREIRPDVPIIVCSGYNEVEVIRKLTSQGVAGFIQKPYTSASLTGKVKLVLEKAAERHP